MVHDIVVHRRKLVDSHVICDAHLICTQQCVALLKATYRLQHALCLRRYTAQAPPTVPSSYGRRSCCFRVRVMVQHAVVACPTRSQVASLALARHHRLILYHSCWVQNGCAMSLSHSLNPRYLQAKTVLGRHCVRRRVPVHAPAPAPADR